MPATDYRTLAPTLPRPWPIADQANQLQGAMLQGGFAVPDVMVVAHSQGGLVSRALAHYQPIKALVTIGTPHLGMPFAGNHDVLTAQVAYTAIDLSVLAAFTYSDLPDFDDPEMPPIGGGPIRIPPDFRWWVSRRALLAGGTLLYGLDVFQNQRWGSIASWDELAPGPYIQSANASVGSEQVGRAFSIMSSEGNGYLGGPLRLLMSGESADELGEMMYEDGLTLEEMAQDIFNMYGYGDLDGLDILAAYSALDLAYRLETVGEWWTYDVVGGYPHDGLVVTERQLRPQSESYQLVGVAHTEETSSLPAMNMMKAILDANRP